MAGYAPSEFWRLTPREVEIALEGAVERMTAQLQRDQALLYSLASLTAHAFHQPAKMPAFQKVFPRTGAPVSAQAPEVMLRSLKAWAAVHNKRFEV